MDDLDPADSSIPKSLAQALKDRLSHPVAGIFIIAWILFNWKMLFFLVVAGSPAEARIAASGDYTNWRVGFLWPVFATVAYLALSPWLQVLVSRWNGWVAEKQSLRAYHDSLVQLQRQTEIEQRAMQSIAPTLRGQQEQKVRVEKEIEHLIKRKADMEQAIVEAIAIQPEQWKNVGPMQPDAVAVVKARLNRIAELRIELEKKYPAMKN